MGGPQIRNGARPVSRQSGEGVPQDPRERRRERGVHGKGRPGFDGPARDQRPQGADDERLTASSVRLERSVEFGYREPGNRARGGRLRWRGNRRSSGRTNGSSSRTFFFQAEDGIRDA